MLKVNADENVQDGEDNSFPSLKPSYVRRPLGSPGNGALSHNLAIREIFIAFDAMTLDTIAPNILIHCLKYKLENSSNDQMDKDRDAWKTCDHRKLMLTGRGYGQRLNRLRNLDGWSSDRGPVEEVHDIVNGLEALGKTYKESEKVMKILRSLPSKWHTKVTAIQETKDLTKLPTKELIGSLMTYEINLTKKLQEGEDKKKKSIALKATIKEEKDV
ncbi:hypothetical protein CK203_020110 [Vitis vinifera]|uniref:UBN2 domain-containing protein n=1 Tax=Vitis vinifera TaxID=29760 RepID=A0A438J8E5_VITVI|nr:hypothetical protein CK203_020110 [Vitis vinifera]